MKSLIPSNYFFQEGSNVGVKSLIIVEGNLQWAQADRWRV